MKPQFIFLLFFLSGIIKAQTDSSGTGKMFENDGIFFPQNVILPDTAQKHPGSSYLFLKCLSGNKFFSAPAIMPGESAGVYELSKYFFSSNELESGLTQKQLFFYRNNKESLGKTFAEIYSNMPDCSLGELGKYLNIGRKTAAFILLIIHLLKF